MKNSFTPPAKPIFITSPIRPDQAVFSSNSYQVFDAGIYTNFGPQVLKLTELLKQRLGANHMMLCGNATLALMLALMIQPRKGRVITTPFTFPATVHVLEVLGFQPVFVDIDPTNWNIDPKTVYAAVDKETVGILPVHVFGNPCDVNALNNIAREFGLFEIYDASHAFDVKLNGHPIGNFGDASAFSFHATKLFHTAEGGALVTNTKENLHSVKLCANFGIEAEDKVVGVGINAKMSEMHAALGIAVLPNVDSEIAHRKKLHLVYNEVLGESSLIEFQNFQPDVERNFQYYPILINGNADNNLSMRDYVFSWLRENNIFARRYFYPLLADINPYKEREECNRRKLPVATSITERVLCLPNHSLVSPELAHQIGSAILQLLKKTKSLCTI